MAEGQPACLYTNANIMSLIDLINSNIVKNSQLMATIVAFERLPIISIQYVVQQIQKREKKKARSTGYTRGYLTRRGAKGRYPT